MGNPSQGWRSRVNWPPMLLPPPEPQTHLTVSTPNEQPQMPSQRNLNLNNKKEQQIYNGETSYPSYVMELQEINLPSARVLPDNHPPCPLEELEKEKEESAPQLNLPPLPKNSIHPR